MHLVALYKTWDGGEFVDASLASIHDHCDHIVMIHSDVSWLGEQGNTVKPLALEWCEEHDHDGKVHHVDVSLTSQAAQYQAGIDYVAKKKLPHDAFLVVDSDEVWEGQYLERAKQQMTDRPCIAYRSSMHTYLKTPFHRVMPPFGEPITFCRDPRLLLKSPRGCRSHSVFLTNVWMHHYTYVRESREAVARKLHQSCHADGGEIVVPNWMTDIYDRLPRGRNLHAFLQWREVWQSIEPIWFDAVPPAMRKARRLPLWYPPGELLDGEAAAIHRLTKGRKQAVDLGTYMGRSAVVLGLACERVHTIDCYENLPTGTFADTLMPNRYETDWGGHSLSSTQELCRRWGNMTCEQADTAEAGGRWSGDPVDVLFVDADHGYDGTKANVGAWLPHIRAGGRVILHDNNEIHPGVQRVVREMEEDSRFRVLECGEYSGSLAAFEVA